MKLNFFMFLITLVICGLIFFGFYKWTDGNHMYSWVSAVVSLLFLTPSLCMTSTEAPRGMAMVKVVSSLIFVTMFIVNVLFAKYETSSTTYIIVNGIAFCIWASAFYGIIRTKQ